MTGLVVEWSVCLAVELPTKVYLDETLGNQTLDCLSEEIKTRIVGCKKRVTVGYLNGACEGCEAKQRLDLGKLL